MNELLTYVFTPAAVTTVFLLILSLARLRQKRILAKRTSWLTKVSLSPEQFTRMVCVKLNKNPSKLVWTDVIQIAEESRKLGREIGLKEKIGNDNEHRISQ